MSYSWENRAKKREIRPISPPWVFRNQLPLTVNTDEFEVLTFMLLIIFYDEELNRFFKSFKQKDLDNEYVNKYQ